MNRRIKSFVAIAVLTAVVGGILVYTAIGAIQAGG